MKKETFAVAVEIKNLIDNFEQIMDNAHIAHTFTGSFSEMKTCRLDGFVKDLVSRYNANFDQLIQHNIHTLNKMLNELFDTTYEKIQADLEIYKTNLDELNFNQGILKRPKTNKIEV